MRITDNWEVFGFSNECMFSSETGLSRVNMRSNQMCEGNITHTLDKTMKSERFLDQDKVDYYQNLPTELETT